MHVSLPISLDFHNSCIREQRKRSFTWQ